MQKYKQKLVLNFANGATAHTETLVDISKFTGGTVIVPAEFNTDTLTFTETDPRGRHADVALFTKVVATGSNHFDATEVLKLAGAQFIKVTTNNAVSAASSICLAMGS